MRRHHTFILKIIREGTENPTLSGQLSEPASLDEWQVAFTDLSQLLARLLERLESIPGQVRDPASWLAKEDRQNTE